MASKSFYWPNTLVLQPPDIHNCSYCAPFHPAPIPLPALSSSSSPSTSFLKYSPHPHTNTKYTVDSLKPHTKSEEQSSTLLQNASPNSSGRILMWGFMKTQRPFPLWQPQPLTFPPLPSCSLTLQGVTDFLFFFFCCMSSLAFISFSSSRRGAWNSPSFRISCRTRGSLLISDFGLQDRSSP